MKSLIFRVLLCLLVAPAFGESDAIPARVIGDSVNLRTGPSRHAEIIGQLPRDFEVRVVLTDGEWSAISPPEGTGGWISRDFLRDGIVTGNRVNVRGGPSVAHAVLLTLDDGVKVSPLEEREDWVKISLPDAARLWLNSRYLSTGSGTAAIEAGKGSPAVTVLPPQREPARELEARTPPAPVSSSPVIRPPVPEPVALPPAPEPVTRPPPPEPVARSPVQVPPPGELRSYTGIIRELQQPFSLADREYRYELAADRLDPRAVAFLTGGTVDLAGYRFRPVRIWAETIEVRTGRPALLEVKGVGFLW